MISRPLRVILKPIALDRLNYAALIFLTRKEFCKCLDSEVHHIFIAKDKSAYLLVNLLTVRHAIIQGV